MTNFDVIIIGGGAAGIMAAISCKKSHPEYSVCLLDRTFALGRKILVCGAGRCNITNINLDKSIDDHFFATNIDFVKSTFSKFSFKDILAFFEDLGIEVYVERKTDIGKMFPVTNQAHTVTALLEDELQRLGVEVYLNTQINTISKKNDEFNLKAARLEQNIEVEDLTFSSKYLVLSAGGKTYPALGSNGSGYELAKKLGHKVIHPVPSALPLVSKNQLSQLLQGVKIDCEVTSVIASQKIKTRSDEVMFTQYGFSGPAILNISREISIRMNREEKSDCELMINFLPGKSTIDTHKMLLERWERRPTQTVEKSLLGIFPVKFPAVFLKIIAIDKELNVGDLSVDQQDEIATQLTEFKVKIDGTRGWNEAEFTAGGVDINEVKDDNLESKLVPNLFFAGEVLDVDGDVGGFNLSWAWSSGNLAGKLLQ